MVDTEGMTPAVVARAADALTAVRVVIAGAVAVAMAQGGATAATALLVVGWLTDAFDGPLARRTHVETKLGVFDAYADASLGFGVIVGMTAAERLATVWLVPSLVLAITMIVARSEAAGMLLQALGYAMLFGLLVADANAQAMAMAVAGIGVVTGVHGRRLFSEMIPKFFADVRRLTDRP